MAVAETGKSRTVADIMSRPVVTVNGDDKMAEAAATMGERRVGSVVAVEGTRPVGILTERDLVRFTASGGDAGTALVSEWMTSSPDSVAPDVDVTQAFASLSEHGYRHIPVVDDGELVGIVSMRDLMRIAQIQPAENLAHEIPRGLEGVVVAETDIGDVRGLEGFYHYRQYNAVDLAEQRSIEDVWHLMFEGALPTIARARGVHGARRTIASDSRGRRRRAPRDRAGRVGGTSARHAAHHGLAAGRARRVPAVARCRRGGAARQRDAGVRGGTHAAHRDPSAATRPGTDRPGSVARVRRELPLHADR